MLHVAEASILCPPLFFSAVKTPQLLELSGIGDPRILQPLGIDVTVSLPGVGNGVIDQVCTTQNAFI